MYLSVCLFDTQLTDQHRLYLWLLANYDRLFEYSIIFVIWHYVGTLRNFGTTATVSDVRH